VYSQDTHSDLLYIEVSFIDSDLLYIEVLFIDSDLLYIEVLFIDSDLLYIEVLFIDSDLPVYKGQLLIKATFSSFLEWLLYTGLTVLSICSC
jgi:uncharacterized protein YuzE